MIAYLKGKPILGNKHVIMVAGGVGYLVYVGAQTLAKLPKQEAELFTHTHVREDKLDLYGFLTREQLRLFELMIDVSGVGPKTAIDIVDRDPQSIISAVQQSRVTFFSSIPRIGKKTAQKIILELKSKLGSLTELSLGPRSATEQDVYETLVALGYEESYIGQILVDIDVEVLGVEEAVKTVLQKQKG